MNSRIVARGGWRAAGRQFTVSDRLVRALTVVALVVSLIGVFPPSQPASAFSEPGANALLTVVKHVDNQEDARGDGSALNVCEVELRVDRLVGGAPEEVTSFPGAEPDVCAGDPQATTGTTTVGIDVDIDRGSPTETFMISEPALDSRYLATISGDCDRAGRVVLAPGDDKTCVVTNTFLNEESMDGSNALLTVVTHVDNGDNVDGSELTVCDFSIALTSLVSGAQVAGFPAEQGFACGLPNLLVGTTQLGVEVDNASHDVSQPSRFIISEPFLDPRYVVTFGGDCVGGDVSIRRGEHQTCVITNTLVGGFQEPGANTILTVVKQLDNQEDIIGDGSALGLCDVEIRVGRIDGGEVDTFPAGSGAACSDPFAISGSTDLGINVNTERTSPSETFIVSEPTLTSGYLATFAGDCDLAGRVELEPDQHKTCVVTNTLLNAESMADANALLTVIKVVDNGANPDGVGLNVCDFQIEVALRDTSQSIATFAAEDGLMCSQPDLVDGTTQLGVAIDIDPRDGPVTSTFLISEPGLDVRYVASFSGDCAGGEVTLRAGEQRTCVITNTLVESLPPVNRAPVANDDGYVTEEDTALSVAAVDGLLANDTDADGDTLAAIDVSEPGHGDVTMAADGAISYSPDAGFNGTDSFSYRASDGSLTSGIATVTITVNAVDNSPVVTVEDLIVEVDEGQVATNSGTVSDADGDVVVLSASIGVVVNNGDGTWSWSFAATDGPTESQTVSINGTTFGLVVVNVAPEITLAGGVVLRPDGSASLGGSFADPGADEWTATFDPGDGSGPQPLSLNADKTFSASHVYLSGGDFTLTVCVSDDNGGVDCDDALVRIVDIDYAIFVGRDTCGGGSDDALSISGSSSDIGGDVHSNSGIKVSGSRQTVDGSATYRCTVKVSGSRNTFSEGPTIVSDVRPWPMALVAGDFDCDITVSGKLDLSKNGPWWVGGKANSRQLAPLTLCASEITLLGSSISGTVTLVASEIKISGSNLRLTAHEDGVLAFATGSGDDAIKVSGSSNRLAGDLVARAGELSLSGSSGAVLGSLIGWTVKVSGSSWRIDSR